MRAGLNLVALRRPDLIEQGLFSGAIDYVLDDADSAPELHALATPLVQSLALEECGPVHCILVSAVPGGESWAELMLFDHFLCKVRIAERWPGPEVGIWDWFESKRFVKRDHPARARR